VNRWLGRVRSSTGAGTAVFGGVAATGTVEVEFEFIPLGKVFILRISEPAPPASNMHGSLEEWAPVSWV
jgi:hypothetical protein